MTTSRLTSSIVIVTMTALVVGAFTELLSREQQRATAAAVKPTFNAPRTPWGDPDLQGTWPSGPLMLIPFERPPQLAARTALSAEEVAERDAGLESLLTGPVSPNAFLHPAWNELTRGPALTSLVSDPPDGRLPPLTADGAERARDWVTRANPNYRYTGPEDMRPYDRCITRGVLGSAFPNVYSAGMQIVQAPGVVVIRHEMIHEARVILLDGRSHLGPAIRSYMGDPRGRWAGDTLVVETTNFNGKTGSYGRNGDGNPTSTMLRLVERFRLVNAATLHYEVRIEDPQTWVRPWTVSFPLQRDEGYVLYEYACHEGNYAIRNILSAVRSAERGQ